MGNDRESRPGLGLLERWLGWITQSVRHLVGERATTNSRLAPAGRAPIVQHTRAGDVYRL